MRSWLRSNWILTLAAAIAVLAAGFSLARPQTDRTPAAEKKDRSYSKRNADEAMIAHVKTRNTVKHAGEKDFAEHVLRSEVPVLVDFYADWCRPCQTLAPVLEKFARETREAKIVKVNVDENPQLAAAYGIQSIPSLIVFKEGKATTQHTGLANKKQLKALLRR